MTGCAFLLFNVRLLAELAQADGRVGWVIARGVSRRLAETCEELASTAFGTVRQRGARHLLDLAGLQQPGPSLVVPVSQQTIADSVGTVREVVARALSQLRSDGLVETRPSGIIVHDPVSLQAEATLPME
jgi:CRP-like cAMP-binding protein